MVRRRLITRHFRYYWMLSVEDFARNALLLWPVFCALAVYLLVASTFLWQFEHGQRATYLSSFPDAIYYTWLTMCTVGNASPTTGGGKAITAADVFVGLLAIGVLIWIITTSLSQSELKLLISRGFITTDSLSRKELRELVVSAQSSRTDIAQTPLTSEHSIDVAKTTVTSEHSIDVAKTTVTSEQSTEVRSPDVG
jgi:hypothetical protein